jgi:hypothetical protein
MDSITKKIRITPQVDLAIDDILLGISDLDTPDLEQFLQKVGRLVARRKSPSVPERETVLLQAINQSLDVDLQNRFKLLLTKQNKNATSEFEHQELLKLIDKIELQYAQRLEYLIELAHLRGVSLDVLMKQLKLNFSHHD